ncbi:MAG: PEGA domain-containing protein, partial [Methanomicrobium sp.]|nr:PEGA domain-containing protein [Methanomicrobium sp.]
RNIPTVLLLLLLLSFATATVTAAAAETATAPVNADTDSETDTGVTFRYFDRYAVCSFSSSPYGAEIYIDGKLAGTEPILNHYLIAGEHTVAMSKTGYKTEEKTFTVAAGERKTIRLNLEEKNSPMAFICLYSYPAGASVTMDGKYIGNTPINNLPVFFGMHSIQYTLDGYESVTSAIAADTGKVSSLSVALKPKANRDPICNFISEPAGATISVDGKYIGTTPFRSYHIAPGTHRIRYSLSGYKDSSDTYNAVYDSSGDIFMTLAPLSAPET